jgi:polyisoprenoid-binding protein YceI
MTTQAVQTRTVAGREIPPPGRWRIDPAHSEIQFVARHMMIARTRGRFREFSGTITIAEVPEQSSVE